MLHLTFCGRRRETVFDKEAGHFRCQWWLKTCTSLNNRPTGSNCDKAGQTGGRPGFTFIIKISNDITCISCCFWSAHLPAGSTVAQSSFREETTRHRLLLFLCLELIGSCCYWGTLDNWEYVYLQHHSAWLQVWGCNSVTTFPRGRNHLEKLHCCFLQKLIIQYLRIYIAVV